MTPNDRRVADVPRPIENLRDALETGQRSLSEGLGQMQDFWNSVARSWGESVGLWAGQPPWAQRRDSTTALRDVQEAWLAVTQAWLRLPFVLMYPTAVMDFQRAVIRLLEANARAFTLWPTAQARPADPRN